MLVAEVRRIIPTAVGLPMELAFYTAAVAAASVECKLQLFSLTVADLGKLFILILKMFGFLPVQATVSPPLPANCHASQLLNSDINITATSTSR